MDERETTAAIDRALAGAPRETGYPDERELRDLTLALAAEAPEPDPAFADELGDRVRHGFPRERRARRIARLAAVGGSARASRPTANGGAAHDRSRGAHAAAGGSGRRWLGSHRSHLLGAAASLVIALAVASALLIGGGDDALDGGPVPNGRSVAQPERGAPGTAPGDSLRSGAEALADERARALAPPASGGATDRATGDAIVVSPTRPRRGGFAPGRDERRIERTAALTLAAPAGRLDHVAGEIAAVTERHRGFVLRSSLTTGPDGAARGGELELRIPTDRLRAALADLAALGQVRARTETGDDVTAAFVTTGDRLEAARAERRGLLRRLARAADDDEADALRARLRANARAIDRLEGRIRALRLRTNYAAVDVSLRRRDGGATGGESDDGLGGALDDALGSLRASLELAIRVLGVALPLGLIAIAGALAARAIRRRRREAALS